MIIPSQISIAPFKKPEVIVLDTDISDKKYRGIWGILTGTVQVVIEDGTTVNIEVNSGAYYPLAGIKRVNSGGSGAILGVR